MNLAPSPALSHVPIKVRRTALLFALAAAAAATPTYLKAQGCVPIKEMGDQTSAIDGVSSEAVADKWDIS